MNYNNTSIEHSAAHEFHKTSIFNYRHLIAYTATKTGHPWKRQQQSCLFAGIYTHAYAHSFHAVHLWNIAVICKPECNCFLPERTHFLPITHNHTFLSAGMLSIGTTIAHSIDAFAYGMVQIWKYITQFRNSCCQ